MKKTAEQIAESVWIKIAGKTGPETDLLALIAAQAKQLPNLRRLKWRAAHPSGIRDQLLDTYRPFGRDTLRELVGSKEGLRNLLVGEGPGFSEAMRAIERTTK